MISQTAEYALRAIVYLADQAGQPRTVMQIAEATQVPAGYLAKVMQGLSRAKLVKSQRGLNGGFTLGRDPRELSVLEVVNVVDPIRRYPECPLGIASHGRQLCPLHRRLDDAAQTVEDAFGNTMVAELLAVPRARKPLCRFPVAAEAGNR
jgi:Rrf2 family transcriptional regulator, nitric oxide-sensitive transcriptional repressor